MKRRLSLARALVNDPDSDLPGRADHRARSAGPALDLGAAASGCVAEGKTILLTTHFMDEAERLCQRVGRDGSRAASSPKSLRSELVLRHIEPQVVEVYGDGARILGAGARTGAM